MDLNEYAIIGAAVNLEQTPAINYKRTLAFLNHFVTNTVRFLNRFSGDCENKLKDLQAKIQKLEITLSILEAKLSSIPGLDDITGPVKTQAKIEEPTNTPSQPTNTPSQPSEVPVQNVDVQATEVPPKTQGLTVSKDPRYMKFFKMLNVGVPLLAVKAKVAMEGLNPDLLDTPDALAPSGSQSLNTGDVDSSNDSDDSASSFSEED